MLVKLKDIATFINGRAYLMPELQNAGKYRIVRVGNFSGKDEWFYSDMELDPEKYCEKGDLLYKWACNFGPEIWKEEKAIYHYHIWKVIPDESKVNKFYLYYKLAVMTPYWLSSTNGSTMVHITKEIMEDKTIELPNIDAQNKLAEILTRLDAQIERNEAMVKRLQVLAQTIYSRWFIEFKYPNSNNKLEFNSILNKKIPSNWKVKKLSDVCTVLLGGTPNTKVKEFWNGNIHWLNSGEIANFPVIDSELKITKLGVEKSATQSMNKGTVVVSITGNIRASFLAIDSCANQSVVGIEENELFKVNYLYPYINNLTYFYQKSSTGNCQKHINKGMIENSDILIPPTELLMLYNKYTCNIYQQITNISLNTQKLIKLKKSIMPLLINGQLK